MLRIIDLKEKDHVTFILKRLISNSVVLIIVTHKPILWLGNVCLLLLSFMASSGKAGSRLPLAGSLQYRILRNYMYWFPLPFQLPIVI